MSKLAVTPITSDAAILLSKALDTFQALAHDKGIALTADIPTEPALAEFDHDRMLQVFANLISNAQPDALHFCLSDTGVGIPPPMLEANFERFWQVGDNDRRGLGLGLGLYISKCILLAHRGKIWAESEAGKGSRFYFTLPRPATKERREP